MGGVWDHVPPSFVTVHKCDGRDLGSTSLKMAAGSRLSRSSLPDFIRWRTRYESVNYGISNY